MVTAATAKRSLPRFMANCLPASFTSALYNSGQPRYDRGLKKASYFPRIKASPCTTIMSLRNTRYLYEPGLIPGRDGPLSKRIPGGACTTFEEKGQRRGS